MMTKSTSGIGQIMFQCRCQNIVVGDPNDTLMAEEYLETAESNLKHAVFIDNSPYDSAANIVFKDCNNCGLDFMTMVRVGTNQQTIYACDCGYRASHIDYMRQLETEDQPPKQTGKQSQMSKPE